MANNAKLGLISGRPYGGVAFIWKKNFRSHIKPIGHDVTGRCRAIS